jgi:heme/copper-type cytochrome/quinol oxidase subunit 1
MTPEFYLSLVTMHGTIMVFFVLTTAPQGGFGNYFLPIQIGADDMAFPTLNMMSFWVTFVGFIVILAAIFLRRLRPSGRLEAERGYAPLSALGQIAGPGQGMGMNLWIISIAIFCVGSLLEREFHYHAPQYAHPRNVTDAYAVDLLGLVYYGCVGAAFFRCCWVPGYSCCSIESLVPVSSYRAGCT